MAKSASEDPQNLENDEPSENKAVYTAISVACGWAIKSLC